jgi:formate transporter
VGGAELFTGKNLVIMAWAGRKVSTPCLLRNWGLVYVGNFIGAAATAALVFLASHHMLGGAAVGVNALAIAQAKCELGFMDALARGVLCNALVCLAVWLAFSARSTTDRVLVIVPPIAAFVAAGFEHSIANMYFIPVAVLIREYAGDAFWHAYWETNRLVPGELQQATSAVTWAGLFKNLLPVTLGNILGGTVLVGGVYWFVYLRRRGTA